MNRNIQTAIAWTLDIAVFLMLTFMFANNSWDRRDVNHDGSIDLIDLSVLATEIDAIKSPYCPE